MKVFVYGTLKKGYCNHDFLNGSTYIGEAWTKKEYTLLEDNRLPYVIKEPSYSIAGEIYEVDERTLMMLDNLEGHPFFYERELVECFIPIKDHHIEEKVWLYFLQDCRTFKAKKLPTGKWE